MILQDNNGMLPVLGSCPYIFIKRRSEENIENGPRVQSSRPVDLDGRRASGNTTVGI